MTQPELVVFSHLPWTFVWQRPQHLISRLAAGRRTWFVEEPRVVEGVEAPRIGVEDHGPVRRVWLELPGPLRPGGFDDPDAADYGEAVAALVGPAADRVVWTYTPMALPLIEGLDRTLLVYDVMDDLSAFAFAPPRLLEEQDRLLDLADVVFTGGRSIHAGVAGRARGPVHLFASGVEPEHFAAARSLRGPRERPVCGYVGVIDERLDLDLVAGLAERLPDWDVHLVGPVFKISPGDVPHAPNLVLPGMQRYEDLPAVMGGFDVALMPFALTDATRSLSPTKTLEYLAAGLPVVSTRIPDVVAGYAGVVTLADDADGFAAACRAALRADPRAREAGVARLLHDHHWDTIAARMQARMAEASARSLTTTTSGASL
jgi:glycosyltransferase involved in cell wall biosynthesis